MTPKPEARALPNCIGVSVDINQLQSSRHTYRNQDQHGQRNNNNGIVRAGVWGIRWTLEVKDKITHKRQYLNVKKL
jgi:hypothetical protein